MNTYFTLFHPVGVLPPWVRVLRVAVVSVVPRSDDRHQAPHYRGDWGSDWQRPRMQTVDRYRHELFERPEEVDAVPRLASIG